ncbi:glycoside hydrolase family 28 protein [Pseudothermotoga sp.]|uniref:glycoside hydrolase family 28 protein n=1 Tax=Pseudothermotoga sp. TaxID=2033661 RepID=UPI0031F66971
MSFHNELVEKVAREFNEKFLANVSEPKIPSREFLIVDFGAVADGRSDCTEAFNKAIKEVSKRGGGRIVIPEGIYLTGPIHLESNVELHLQNATIKFYTDPKKYLPVVLTRFEGMELYNYSPLIYANGKINIAITGRGVLDGQASEENWWIWKGKEEFGWKVGMPNQLKDVAKLTEMVKNNVPVEERIFGEGHFLRPNFIQFYNCKNVLLEGFELINSPMWCIHPVLCENVIVRNVKVRSRGPNNDGINPESCRYVLIEKCFFDTGDDSIAVKSGRNEDGRRIAVPCEYVLVRDNVVLSEKSHGGFVIGSEMSGGVRKLMALNNSFINLERVLRIKTNSRRGGFVEDVYFFNNVAVNVSEEFIVIHLDYDNETGDFPPTVRNIFVKNFKGIRGKYGIRIKGLEESKVLNVHLQDCSFEDVQSAMELSNCQLFLENVRIGGNFLSKATLEGNVRMFQ